MKPQPQDKATRPLKSYLLLECMVYISLVMVLVGLMLVALHRAFNHSTRLRQVTTQIIQTLEAGERWRAEVRSSVGQPFLQQENNVAWLRLPQSTGEVVYAVFDQAIWRRTDSNPTWTKILDRVRSASFEPVSRSRVEAWRWELELATTNRPVRLIPLFTFQAVPGFTMQP